MADKAFSQQGNMTMIQPLRPPSDYKLMPSIPETECVFTARYEQNFYIQDDSGGICNTLENDSMCDSKQKSSYEHGSDFERLPRYGKKKIRTILRARTAIT